MYSISEISEKLGISKQTVYKRLQSISGISEHVTMNKKSIYVDDIGLELIEKTLNTKSLNKNKMEENIEGDITEEDIKNRQAEDLKIIKELKKAEKKLQDELTPNEHLVIKHTRYIENLEQEIEYLREEMQLKNILIEEQTKQLGNSQMLLLESKRKLALLESSIAVTKEEIPEEEVQEEKPKNVSKPISFLKRVLKY